MDKQTLSKYFTPSSHRVAIYVPDLGEESVTFKSSVLRSYTEAAALFLSSLYGGATISPVSGYWLSGTTLHRDDINVVYSYTGTVDLKRTVEFCIQLLRETGEEAIALEIDGALHFIDNESVEAYTRDHGEVDHYAWHLDLR